MDNPNKNETHIIIALIVTFISSVILGIDMFPSMFAFFVR